MTYLQYSGKKFKILNEYSLNTSSRQVTFSDLTIDFTDKTLNDLPIKFQEVQIKKDNEIIFTGYVNSFTLPSMNQSEGEFRELTLNLLSPLSMATNKVVTIIGTYKLEEVIRRALSPLLLDGFEIAELNVRDGQKTVNFLMQTTEFVMNSLSNTESLWWFIDENKQIYINSIDYQFGLLPKMTLTHNEKVDGLLSITPSIEAVNYANVINVKNARVYFISWYYSHYDDKLNNKPLFDARTLKKGDSIDFKYPIDISEDTIRAVKENDSSTGVLEYDNFYIQLGDYKEYYIALKDDKYIISNGIGFSEEDKKIITLKRDDFFKNLITGFTYNGDTATTVMTLKSETALEFRTMKFINSQEIELNKGKITKSGVIEKTIDMNARWFFMNDLVAEVRSNMYNNANQTNILKLEFDVNKKLKLGDIIEINLPKFLTQGNYIITDINYTSSNIEKWNITLRSSDVLENFIDLFREKEKQEIDDQIETVIISEYVEEKMNEIHEVVEHGNN